MARKRVKRRGFGSAPETHRRMATTVLHDMRFMMRDAREHMRRGDCRKAVSAARMAEFLAGRYEADRYAMGDDRKADDQSQRVANAADRLWDELRSKCFCKR